MISTKKQLRHVIKNMVNEISMQQTRMMPSGDDRRFAVSTLPKGVMQASDISQTDAVKLMSASTGFFQTLVDAIRFGFLTREEVNKICNSLESGCEDNFKTLVVSHPCLKWWKNDVSKIAARIGDDTEFKRDFCESIKSNCEMVRSNYNRALGNIKQISM
tara:strand:+ start:74 stop:553 length:480 start_codon:yes stop_codon:yes gene_type:complete